LFPRRAQVQSRTPIFSRKPIMGNLGNRMLQTQGQLRKGNVAIYRVFEIKSP